jgi:hypothetical protein
MWSVPDVNHVSGTDLGCLACPARFERATYALEGRCSIQLSYGQMDFLDFNGMLEPWEFGKVFKLLL